MTGTGRWERNSVLGFRGGRPVTGVRPPVLSVPFVGDRSSESCVGRAAEVEGAGDAAFERGRGLAAAADNGVFDLSASGIIPVDGLVLSSSFFSRSRSFSFLFTFFFEGFSDPMLGLPGAVELAEAPLTLDAFSVSFDPVEGLTVWTGRVAVPDAVAHERLAP